MYCIRANHKRSSYSESDRRQSEDLSLIASDFYRYNRSRHTIFWRSFNVLRHSFNCSDHKTNRQSVKCTSPDHACGITCNFRTSVDQYKSGSKKRRNTYEKCDKTQTYGVRDLALSTDWVIIDEITNDNNSQCHRRPWVRRLIPNNVYYYVSH